MEYSFLAVFYRIQRLSRFTNKNRAGIAQLVERPTEALPRFYVGLYGESTVQGQLENIGQTYAAVAAKLT